MQDNSDNERRTERRDPCTVKVEYTLTSVDCSAMDCGPWTNTTADISYSGMGIYSQEKLKEDQRLKIFLRHLSSVPITASVRWCRRLSDGLYRVGLKYF